MSRRLAELSKRTKASASTFAGDRFDITLFYRLGPNDRFVEKWLEVKAKDGQGFLFNSVVLEDAAAGDWLKEIHFHDDQSVWHCPINYFLRGDKGGCFRGPGLALLAARAARRQGFRHYARTEL